MWSSAVCWARTHVFSAKLPARPSGRPFGGIRPMICSPTSPLWLVMSPHMPSAGVERRQPAPARAAGLRLCEDPLLRTVLLLVSGIWCLYFFLPGAQTACGPSPELPNTWPYGHTTAIRRPYGCRASLARHVLPQLQLTMPPSHYDPEAIA